jgi:hypothetical protein
MPLKKYIPPRSTAVSLGGTRVSTSQITPSPGPVLVPILPPTPPPPPAGGAFSNAFSNAFDI